MSGNVVVVDGSMQYSLDGGANFARFDVPPPFAADSSLIGTVFKVVPAGPNVFAYATGGNFVSPDWGKTWNPMVIGDKP